MAEVGRSRIQKILGLARARAAPAGGPTAAAAASEDRDPAGDALQVGGPDGAEIAPGQPGSLFLAALALGEVFPDSVLAGGPVTVAAAGALGAVWLPDATSGVALGPDEMRTDSACARLRLELGGPLLAGGRDLALALTPRLAELAPALIEVEGPAADRLSLVERISFCITLAALAGVRAVFQPNLPVLRALSARCGRMLAVCTPDPAAVFGAEVRCDAARAAPVLLDLGPPLALRRRAELAGLPVESVLAGFCTEGWNELAGAALADLPEPSGPRPVLLAAAATADEESAWRSAGVAAELERRGFELLEPGCLGCLAAHARRKTAYGVRLSTAACRHLAGCGGMLFCSLETALAAASSGRMPEGPPAGFGS